MVGVGLLVKGASDGVSCGFSVEDKFRLVLAVVSGEVTCAEAARRGKTERAVDLEFGSGSSLRAVGLMLALRVARTRGSVRSRLRMRG